MYEQVDTGRKCVTCGDRNILARITREFSSLSPPIIGPGSQNQYTERVTFACPGCGVMYLHPPQDPGAEERILQERWKREANFPLFPELPKG